MRFSVETDGHTGVHDVTDRVVAALTGDVNGVVTVFVRHTTASVVVNEAEDRLCSDIETFLEDIVSDTGWEHDRIDDNADSHLRTLLLGESVTVPVEDGALDLGTWQSILLVECDGPRLRHVDVVVH